MLSLFNPFSLKRIWDNYDSELFDYMLQKRCISSYIGCPDLPSYDYLDVIRLFSRPYFNDTNKALLKHLFTAGASISAIDDLFADQKQVNILSSVNQDLLKLLIDDKCLDGIPNPRGYLWWTSKQQLSKINLDLFRTQEQVNRLNNISLNWLSFLFDKGIVGVYDTYRRVNFINKIVNKENMIDNLNSINFDLFNTLIDGVINKSLRRNEKLDQLGNALHYLSLFLNNKENVKKFNSVNHDFLNILIDASDNYRFSSHLNDISNFFDRVTQENLDSLCSNVELVATLVNKGTTRSAANILELFNRRYRHEYAEYWRDDDIEKLNNHLDLLTVLIDKGIIKDIYTIDYLLYIMNDGVQSRKSGESIDRLYSLDPDLLTVLIDKEIIKELRDLPCISKLSKRGIDNLNSLGSGLLTILIDKGIIMKNDMSRVLCDDYYHVVNGSCHYVGSVSGEELSKYLSFIGADGELGWGFKARDFIVNVRNNLSLTKTILNMDGLIEVLGIGGIKELINHPKYVESSDYLIRNCQLALALYQKGAIENITVDYLFNSTQIQSDVTEFLKDVELADADDNITSSMGEVINGVFNVVNDNPMPTLGNLSLTAFAKTLPSVGIRRT